MTSRFARGGRVFSVIADRDASVWLGTSDGLNRWNRGQITVYRKRNGHLGAQRLPESIPRTAVREIRDDGLPDDSFESVFQDDRGRSWVSTPRWVAYFEDGRFKPVGSGCVSPLLSEKCSRQADYSSQAPNCVVWASVGQCGPTAHAASERAGAERRPDQGRCYRQETIPAIETFDWKCASRPGYYWFENSGIIRTSKDLRSPHPIFRSPGPF